MKMSGPRCTCRGHCRLRSHGERMDRDEWRIQFLPQSAPKLRDLAYEEKNKADLGSRSLMCEQEDWVLMMPWEYQHKWVTEEDGCFQLCKMLLRCQVTEGVIAFDSLGAVMLGRVTLVRWWCC